MTNIIVAVVSLIAGAAISWWLFRLYRGQMDKPYTALRACQQQLEERVREVQTLRNENEQMTSSLRLEVEKRAIAETRASRIGELEAELGQRERSLSELATKNAELETRSVEERKAAEEKLKLINGAQVALSDAFKALSADALKSNNESFIERANATFEKFQESSRTDLASRQKAIDDLVRPLNESLAKYDSKLGDIEKARIEAYSALNEQLRGLLETHLPSLHHETENLVRALR